MSAGQVFRIAPWVLFISLVTAGCSASVESEDLAEEEAFLGVSQYLSDLSWSSASNGWGPVERDISNGESSAGDGRALTLSGVTYAKGLGVHAPSTVRYALPGSGDCRFRARFGVDDEVGSSGSVGFQVFVGTSKVFESQIKRGYSKTGRVDVAVGTAQELTLVVTDGADNTNYDHADWASARLECAAPTSSALPAPIGLVQSSKTQTSAAFSWTAVTAATGYGVYRDGVKLQDVTDESFTLSGLSCGTTFTFAVDAVDASGARSSKSSLAASTSACDSQPPPPPPPPTGALKGWELTPTNVGLGPHGLSCASLPIYSGPNVLPAGTTISGKRITIPLDVSAGGIVIEKSCIKPTSAEVGLIEGYYPQGDITIRDSEFDGSLVPPASLESACAFTGGANLLRNYIHDVGSGICMVSSTNTRDQGGVPKNILIMNNYVHKLFHYSDAHHEAATVRDFVMNADNSRSMRWVGNFLNSDCQYVSGGLFLQPTFEPFHNIALEDNVFAGEGFNLWLTDSGCCTYSNMRAINNRFKAGTREWYGPVYTQGGPGWTEWSNNNLYDGTQPDARGAEVNKP
jgi:hypothetical protein